MKSLIRLIAVLLAVLPFLQACIPLIVGAGVGSLPATDKTLSAQLTAYAASINPVTAAHDSTATHP